MVYTKFVYTYCHCSPYLLFIIIVGILSSQTIQQVKAYKIENTTTTPEENPNTDPTTTSSTCTDDPNCTDPDSPSPTEQSEAEAEKDMILLPPSVFETTTAKSKHHRNLKSLVQRKMPFYEEFLNPSQKRVLMTAIKTFGLLYSVLPVKRGSGFDSNDTPENNESDQIRAFELLGGIVGRSIRDTIACSSTKENSTARKQAKCDKGDEIVFYDKSKNQAEEDILCSPNDPENAFSDDCKKKREKAHHNKKDHDHKEIKVIRGPVLDFTINVQSSTSPGYSVNLPSTGKLADAIEHGIWKASSPTKIIVTIMPYEFMGGKKYLEMLRQKMISAFGKKYGSADPHNIIKIDWPEISSKKLSISQIAARFLPTAEKLARIITRWSRKKQIQLDKLHIIGASAGAHFAGAVAHIIKEKMHGEEEVARITGLDPLGWGFDEMDGYGVDPEHELDKEDAEFVDIIHTSSPDPNYPFIHYGSNEKRGTADFYPNNGRSQYCAKTDGLCHHFYSIILYTASITGANFVGCHCTSWDDFIVKRLCFPCTESAKMGEDIDTEKATGVYYLATA